MITNLEHFLSPGCNHLRQKISFFAVFENWVEKQSKKIVNDLKMHIFQSSKDKYYHSLYHLLTCPFCLDRAYDILHDKVHPQLSHLIDSPSNLFIREFIDASRHLDIASRYFCIFWKKMATSEKVISYPCISGKPYEVIQNKAAGIADDFPDQIPLLGSEDMSLCFEYDTSTANFHLFIIGGSAAFRQKIHLKLYYHDGSCDEFHGESIAIGGSWTIEAQKANNICLIEFHFSRV